MAWGIQLELDYLYTEDKCVLSSWGYYCMAAGKERGERGGKGEATIGAGKCKVHP